MLAQSCMVAAACHINTKAPRTRDGVTVHHSPQSLIPTQGHFEAAIADYTQALRVDPSHTRTLFNRASCYEKLQRLEAALADYSTAITLEEGSARAYFTRQEHSPCHSVDAPAALVEHMFPASVAETNACLVASCLMSVAQVFGALNGKVRLYTQILCLG